MNEWDALRRIAGDRRSGAAEIAVRAAEALGGLESRRDIMRAARRLLRAHPAMAPLWRLLATALIDGPAAIADLKDRLESETGAVVRAATWAIPRRAVVLTHSASSSVAGALIHARAKVRLVICSASLPGGEGRRLAARLRREGIDAEVVADAEVVRACARATVALVGADAVTECAVINKVGTSAVALAAREEEIGCYALAGTSKLIPHAAWNPDSAPLYEATPLGLFDAVITERGPVGPGPVRRAVARIEIPNALLGLVRDGS